MHIRPLLSRIFFLVLIACCLPVQAKEERGHTPGDSLLMAYSQRIRERRDTPEGLAMCDTLFKRAGAAKWKEMQAVALCLRLDHFYFKNDREGILDGVERVQEFCRKNGKKELAYYYYFAWGSRLVTYYTKRNQFNVAVYESRRMLAEAQADAYPRGEAECYRALANLYLVQNSYDRAYENFRRQADVFERHGIRDLNLPTLYASLAECALELDMPDSALVAIRKGRALRPETPYQRFSLDKSEVLYHLEVGDFETARQYLDSAEMRFRGNPSMALYVPGLRSLKTKYYRETGQYDKALESVQASLRDTVFQKSSYLYNELLKDEGDIYRLRGDLSRAAESYHDYITLSDSLRTEEMRSGTDDVSGILEIARLQGETRELQFVLQQRRLSYTYVVIGLLALLLVSLSVVFARVIKLNRRLKLSEAVVKAQNEHLVSAGEELRRAKESAEKASRMKSDFIQSMSHEVRTPLNSIMGFSQVLAAKFRNDPTVGEYASILEASGLNLLRLVDDVLDIAFLDQTDDLPRPDYTAINDICHECVSRELEQLKPGVTMIFEPSADDPKVFTNRKRIVQVLRHLLHNAAKFTVEGEIILTYACLMPERMMRFTVADTGPGIPADKQELVFDRFVKLDDFAQGTGLGLPVCRLIAAKLGGSLRIDPSYTNGCRMILEIAFELPPES